MKTSSWFTPLPPGYAGIGISRSVPAGFRHLPTYRALAPGAWFRSCASPAQYAARYAEILAKLDPGQVVLDLQRMAGAAEPVLLCWEHPPPNLSLCHRALVSAWLHESLGLVVPEIGHEDLGNGWSHPKLHPTLAPQSPRQAPLPFAPPNP